MNAETYLGLYQTSLMELFYENCQPEIICSKLALETLEQGVKYVQS